MDIEDVKTIYYSEAEYEIVRSRIREIITKLRIVEFDLERESAANRAAGRPRYVHIHTRKNRRRN